jgi:K+/H+ antiporter YhaU regulatory subunit KhtT
VYRARYKPTQEKKVLKVVSKEQNTERQISFSLAKHYTKSREFCTTRQHILDMRMSVIEVNSFAFALRLIMTITLYSS